MFTACCDKCQGRGGSASSRTGESVARDLVALPIPVDQIRQKVRLFLSDGFKFKKRLAVQLGTK